MALAAALEADLRALSAEARRKYPAVKDAAEHAILKLRTITDPSQISRNDDVLRLYMLACDTRNVKLSILGLSCLQKLLAHDAVPPLAFPQILETLQEHCEINDEILQLKTLQTILTILQSKLHPGDENSMSILLGLCLGLLGKSRNPDSVQSTAAATLRQAIALIFERVVYAEDLPAQKGTSSRRPSRSNSVSGDVSRSMMTAKTEETAPGSSSESRVFMTQEGRLGLKLFEDLTSLAAGGQAKWLSFHSLQRTFAFDMLDYVLSNYISLFKNIRPYQEVLRNQVCSLLATSLRTTTGAEGEPHFRRIILRAVANVIRLYSSIVLAECEVFVSFLVKSTDASLPSWHRIMVLEILRGFCIEARILCFLFETFDMQPENSNVVGAMVKALSRIVISMQAHDNEESWAAVSGMFNSKAKGVEWSLDNDVSGAAIAIVSEAHAITLAVEGLLGVVFTVATLTDEASESGEVASPRCENPNSSVIVIRGGPYATLCIAMVNALWRTLLEALSLVLSRCQGEALVLEILKAYQAFTQACGVLRIVEPRDAFLSSLCKFTIAQPVELEKATSGGHLIPLIPLTPAALKRSEPPAEPRESVVLTPKNVQALRTLFNVAHRLDNVLDSSWILVLETLAALDRVIHSPHATTQEISTVVPRITRDQGSQSSDFNILSTLDAQLFESSGIMSTPAVRSLLAGLMEVSSNGVQGLTTGLGLAGTSSVSSVFNLDSFLNWYSGAHVFWEELTDHFIKLAEHESSQVRTVALDALDRSICAVLACDQVRQDAADDPSTLRKDAFECAVILPIKTLFDNCQKDEVQSSSLKILLHLLERHGEKLHHSWPDILDLLRSVANTCDKELVPLGFQSLQVILNDCLMSIPSTAMDMCVDVAAAYGAQKTDINISLTSVGLLWATSDFFARGVNHEIQETEDRNVGSATSGRKDLDCDTLLLAVLGVIQKLGTDDRPEVRNSAIRTLFQSVSSHGHRFSGDLWDNCLWILIFPLVETVRHLAANSSKEESVGKELGMHGGKPVHMLVHHSRNTAQKQWDESLVLVLNGLGRLLKPFLHLFQTLDQFGEAWTTILLFGQESIVNGSKEVALAAISTLQTIVVAYASKGSVGMDYFKTAFNTYEKIVYNVCHSSSKVMAKAKQELLQSLAEVYVQGYKMFDQSTYLRLLALTDLLSRNPVNSSDGSAAGRGGIPQVQRTSLEVLPTIKPLDATLAPMWPSYFQQLVSYLPGGEQCEHCKLGEEIYTKQQTLESALSKLPSSKCSTTNGQQENISQGFSEKVADILVDLYKLMPSDSKELVLPDIIGGLGRCMAMRRDFPDAGIWRTAVKAYNRILQDEFSPEASGKDRISTVRAHVWKELIETYENFLVGTCGRAVVLPSGEPAAEALKADESLEACMLDVLSEKVFACCEDAPEDVISRFIDLIDRCAARTCALSLESAALLPHNCGRFSLLCLQKLFHICSCGDEGLVNPSRIAVSRMALPVLMGRCNVIIRQFSFDEKLNEGALLPSVRKEEMYCVLEELSRLVLHPLTATTLKPSRNQLAGTTQKRKLSTIRDSLSVSNGSEQGASERAHLLLLYSPLCDLHLILGRNHFRDDKIRESLQVLLRLVGPCSGHSLRVENAGSSKVCPLFCNLDLKVVCGNKELDGACYNCCNLPDGCRFVNPNGTTAACS
ncbi:hypothetical protein SELMODRAFT_444206 [Selaginella moellendorffii]|uniref:Uncharacterized protein n=1 Tax=Selaginella moellendorffii TaxID=88036 RepID=D8S7V0_SELML|nr:hypothetical protein SELMODRAFT_444206 [Selaginella moellendorffii]